MSVDIRERHAFLPYARQAIDADDVAAVTAALTSDWLTTGPEVGLFEAALTEQLGSPSAVVCNSGTAALHIAYGALGVGPGDAVIVPAITFVATANAARYLGAQAVFADVDAETGLMTLAGAEAAIAEAAAQGLRPRLIVPVHLAGQVADPPGFAALAAQHGLHVVEDACHAIGTTYRDARGRKHRVGDCAHSSMASFSFHPAKTIAMGEGGAVLTRDLEAAERMRRLRSHGLRSGVTPPDPDGAERGQPAGYTLDDIGHNYRAPDLLCALGRSQLAKLPRFVGERRRLAAVYRDRLKALAPAVRPLALVPDCTPAWHLQVVLIDVDRIGVDRDTVMVRLHGTGVGSQVHYIPVPWQPPYRQALDRAAFPGAADYFRRTLSLPLYVGLSDADVVRVVEALGEACGL